jgi:glycerol kinase
LILLKKSKPTLKVPDNGGVFVPALTGLVHHIGINTHEVHHRRNYERTTNAHIARATLEGIAYQVYDLVKAMEADFGKKGTELRLMVELPLII